MVCDAPAHGRQYHDDIADDYPEGSPDGLILEDLMQEFKAKDIDFTCLKLNNSVDKML